MRRSTKRFSPSLLSERLVPVLLAVLLFALIATLVVIFLSASGLTPGA
jgi:hypothetical protein